MLKHARLWAVLIVLPVALIACDDEADAPEEAQVRAIKYITLDQRAGLQQRRIAGIVKAAITANVGFETGGQVTELLRKAGDQVTEGDLIARLDSEPYRLQLEQARNALDQALALADDAQKKFDQQRQLRTQGYATQTALDSAESVLKNAQGAVGVAQSQHGLALRELSKTDLKAPFSGVIARQSVEVFEEVTSGQSIYALQTSGEDKIEASLPETLINIVALGSRVEVNFPPLGDATVIGTVDEIAPLTGEANAYPIEVGLERAPPGLRAGMSAELLFSFAADSTGTAFQVPLTAVKAGLSEDESAVFVFDPAARTLSEQPVEVVNVNGNMLEIVGALSEGDIIASAGISFLHDGMKVDLFDPAKLQ